MKGIFRFSFVLLLALSLQSCYALNAAENGVNNGDWSYVLPNNYEIWRINSREIICGKMNGPNSISNVISENYILEFTYDDRYVCLKCVEASKDLSIDIDVSNPKFYIIDTKEDEIYGTYIKSDFEDQVKKLELSFSDWTQTTPIPDGAIFE